MRPNMPSSVKARDTIGPTRARPGSHRTGIGAIAFSKWRVTMSWYIESRSVSPGLPRFCFNRSRWSACTGEDEDSAARAVRMFSVDQPAHDAEAITSRPAANHAVRDDPEDPGTAGVSVRSTGTGPSDGAGQTLVWLHRGQLTPRPSKLSSTATTPAHRPQRNVIMSGTRADGLQLPGRVSGTAHECHAAYRPRMPGLEGQQGDRVTA